MTQSFDLPTPCYVVDEGLLEKNLKILNGVMQRTGCKIVLTQKAFSMDTMYPLIGEYLSGTTASGLYEARLGHKEMGKENHVFSPAYRDDELMKLSPFVIMSSLIPSHRWKNLKIKYFKLVTACRYQLSLFKIKMEIVKSFKNSAIKILK